MAHLELIEEKNEWELVTRLIDELLSGRISGLDYFALFFPKLKEKIREYLTNQLQSADEKRTETATDRTAAARFVDSEGSALLPGASARPEEAMVRRLRRRCQLQEETDGRPLPGQRHAHAQDGIRSSGRLFSPDTHVLLPHRIERAASDGCVVQTRTAA